MLDEQRATIWVLTRPVRSIESDRVSLFNLRIKVTGCEGSSSIYQKYCAIFVKSGHNLLFHDIEVRGTMIELPEKEGVWKYSTHLPLGQLAYGREYNLLLKMIVPVDCQIDSQISGLEFEPRKLTPGVNEIRLHIDKLPEDTLINGTIFLFSPSLKIPITLTAHIQSLPDEKKSLTQNSIVWELEYCSKTGTGIKLNKIFLFLLFLLLLLLYLSYK